MKPSDRDESIEIPDKVVDLMSAEEVDNMKSRNGWATGTAVLVNSDGTVVRSVDDVWIELFNGEGESGVFSGTRFIGVEDGEYIEAYAHPEKQDEESEYWFIQSFNEDDVDYNLT